MISLPLTPEIVFNALDAIVANPGERPGNTMDVHYIQEAFRFLQDSKDVDEEAARTIGIRVSAISRQILPAASYPSTTFVQKIHPFLWSVLKSYTGRTKKRPQIPKGRRLIRNTRRRAKRIWQLLRDWQILPGTLSDGTVSVEKLSEWVQSARKQAKEIDRLEVCDLTLGELFSKSPEDTDSAKPLIAIQKQIEDCQSSELERGFAIGLRNLRGVFSKALYEGGIQERELAAVFERYAQLCAQWTRTAGVLRSVSECYQQDAEREDERSRISR